MAPAGSTTIIASGADSTSCVAHSVSIVYRLLGMGQPHPEGRPLGRVEHADRPSVCLDGDLAERQTETAAGRLPRPFPIHTEVAIEDPLADLCRHTRALVGDPDLDPVVFGDGDRDRATVGRVADRVVDEVLEDATEERLVRVD